MDHDDQTYAFPLNCFLTAFPQSSKQFHNLYSEAMDNKCMGFFSTLFSDEQITSNVSEALDLDDCFLKCGKNRSYIDESVKKSWLKSLYPIINSNIFCLEKNRVNMLKLLIGYANYLGLYRVAIDFSVPNEILLNYLAQAKKELSHLNLILLIQVSEEKGEEIWKKYIHFLQEFKHSSVQIVLEIKANLPSLSVVNRWKAQNILALAISRECFVLNPKGFPVLPFKHEKIFVEMVKIGIYCSIPNFGQKNKEYFDYLKFVYQKKIIEGVEKRQKDAAYMIDYLQHPLQPYADNLESETYSVFEFDSPKYGEYQQALIQAFETFPQKKRIVLYYIGAGRGGLLYNIFKASKRTKRTVFVYAIEKNPYPIQTIKKRVRQKKWEKNIKIVHTDVKDYIMPEPADIFLSELLGAFGDNELSPQCLFWAEKYIRNQTICIPQNYFSYIRPISYQKVSQTLSKEDKHIYYTVNLGRYFSPFQCKKMWQFEHPLKISKNQNQIFQREGYCIFQAKEDIVLNGFGGYFTSKLYGTAELSILPENFTLGMFSWYPIFFPFEESVYLKKEEKIQIWMKRNHKNKKVWYEWGYKKQGEEIYESIVHNKDGWKVEVEL